MLRDTTPQWHSPHVPFPNLLLQKHHLRKSPVSNINIEMIDPCDHVVRRSRGCYRLATSPSFLSDLQRFNIVQHTLMQLPAFV